MIVAVAIALGAAAGCATAARPSAPDPFIAALDAYVEPLVRMHDFAGTVLVARGGRTLAARRYEPSADGVRVRPDSTARYAIGSITKTMTAAAIMTLVDRGAVRLSSPARTYLPGLALDSVTVFHLLAHSSGVPDYFGWAEYAAGRERPLDDAAFVAVVSGKPLDFRPGTSSRYSSTGYRVLGAIIERVSGEPYERFVRSQVLEPAGLRASGDLAARQPGDDIVPGEDPGFPPSWVQPGARVDVSWLKASGSAFASAHDLYMWGEVNRARWAADSTRIARAGGWGARTRFGRKMMETTGRIPTGYASYLGVYPVDDIVVVVLSHIQSAVTDQMGIDIAGLLLREAITPPRRRGGIDPRYAPHATTLVVYAGRYEIAPGFVLAVRSEPAGLSLAGPDGVFLPLDAEAADTFFFRPLYVPITFKRDAAGHVAALDWSGQFTARRVGQ